MSNDRDKCLLRTKTPLDPLPPVDTNRWTARRKAAVLDAVFIGVISIEEVCRRYNLTLEEFLSWHNAMETHGLPGLRTTRLQNYRHSRPKRAVTAPAP